MVYIKQTDATTVFDTAFDNDATFSPQAIGREGNLGLNCISILCSYFLRELLLCVEFTKELKHWEYDCMYLLVCMCFIVIEFKRVKCDIINQLYTKCRVKDALCIIIMFVNNFTRILELFNFMKSNIILCWKDNKYAQRKMHNFVIPGSNE